MVYKNSLSGDSIYYTRREISKVYKEMEGHTSDQMEQEIADLLQQMENPEAVFSVTGSYEREQQLLFDMKEQVHQVGHYDEYLKQIETDAKRLAGSSLFGKQDSFAFRKAQKIPIIYDELKNIVPIAADSEGVLLAVDSGITDVLICFLLLVFGITLVISERENSLLQLIKPTFKGYFDTAAAKWIAFSGFSALTVLFFYGCNYLLGAMLFGMGDLSRPIQSLRGYLTSPYPCSVLAYLIVLFIMKILVFQVVAAVIFLVCNLVKTTITACLFSAVVIIAELVLYLKIDIHSYLSFLKVLNLICIVNIPWYFQDYRCMNLFDQPINVVPICVALAILLFAASLIFAVLYYCKNDTQTAEKKSVFGGLTRRKRAGTCRSMLFYEGYKLIVMEKAWILLAALLVFQWGSYRDYRMFADIDEVSYKHYISWAEGSDAAQTRERYLEEERRIQKLGEKTAFAANDYSNGKITFAELDEVQSEFWHENKKMIGLSRAIEQCDYVLQANENGMEAELFYDSAWRTLLGENGEREDVLNVGKLILVLAIGLAAVFSIEKESHTQLLLHTSVRGRKPVILRKLLVSLFYGSLAYCLAFFPRYLTVFSVFGTAGMKCSIHGFDLLGRVPLSITMGEYLLLAGAVRYVGMCAAIILVLFLSEMTGNMRHTIYLSVLLLLFPVLLFFLGLTGESRLTLLPIMSGHMLTRWNVVGAGYLLAVSVICVLLVVGIMKKEQV